MPSNETPGDRQAMLEALLAVCRRYNAPDSIIRESYISYVPRDWNHILVLAESQNLNHDEYVQYLNSLTRMEKMRRLYLKQDEVGVRPWDDGHLKLAVEAAFGKVAAKTAVSNAVPWSQRKAAGKNANPDNDLQRLSSALWREMLGILQPKLVICSGKVAENVIKRTGLSDDKIKKLQLPSPTQLNRVSGMFDEDDLLIRYPEVKRVLDKHPEWGEKPYRKNKIFFACHAVSRHKGNTTNPSS